MSRFSNTLQRLALIVIAIGMICPAATLGEDPTGNPDDDYALLGRVQRAGFPGEEQV